MKVSEIMTRDLACCTADTPLQEVARMMVAENCGEIPVQSGKGDRRLVGVITDRDMVCRAIAQGKNPLEMTAAQCMSSPVVTVTPQTSLEDCVDVMEEKQVRRVPVVDDRGACCGIVAQADIAVHAATRYTAELVKEVSKPSSAPSRVSH